MDEAVVVDGTARHLAFFRRLRGGRPWWKGSVASAAAPATRPAEVLVSVIPC